MSKPLPSPQIKHKDANLSNLSNILRTSTVVNRVPNFDMELVNTVKSDIVNQPRISSGRVNHIQYPSKQKKDILELSAAVESNKVAVESSKKIITQNIEQQNELLSIVNDIQAHLKTKNKVETIDNITIDPYSTIKLDIDCNLTPDQLFQYNIIIGDDDPIEHSIKSIDYNNHIVSILVSNNIPDQRLFSVRYLVC